MATPQQARERREYLKARNRCTCCTKQDAYTLIGKFLCAECSEKRRESTRLYAERHKDRIKQRDRSLYAKREQQGKCVNCGRKMDREGRKTCSICAKKQKKVNDRKVINKNRGHNGLCWTCNKVPHEPGEKLCKACHEKMAKAIAKAREHINRENHHWRKLDRLSVQKHMETRLQQAE